MMMLCSVLKTRIHLGISILILLAQNGHPVRWIHAMPHVPRHMHSLRVPQKPALLILQVNILHPVDGGKETNQIAPTSSNIQLVIIAQVLTFLQPIETNEADCAMLDSVSVSKKQ